MRGHGHSCLESRRPQRSSLGLDSSHHGCLKQADVHLQTGPVQKWWKQRVGPAACSRWAACLLPAARAPCSWLGPGCTPGSISSSPSSDLTGCRQREVIIIITFKNC